MRAWELIFLLESDDKVARKACCSQTTIAVILLMRETQDMNLSLNKFFLYY